MTRMTVAAAHTAMMMAKVALIGREGGGGVTNSNDSGEAVNVSPPMEIYWNIKKT